MKFKIIAACIFMASVALLASVTIYKYSFANCPCQLDVLYLDGKTVNASMKVDAIFAFENGAYIFLHSDSIADLLLGNDAHFISYANNRIRFNRELIKTYPFKINI